MIKTALIGASGFVGRAFEHVLRKSGTHQVVSVTRASFDDLSKEEYDLIIHTAMPSKRWWAMNHPLDDFDATVGLTAKILYQWKFKKLLLVSSVSARIQLDHPYGRHKYLAEELVLKQTANHLVCRLGGLYGAGLDKGVIFDMMQGNQVFMTPDSAFNYIDTFKACEIMLDRSNESGLIEVGARNTINIGEIAKHFNWKVEFGQRKEFQDTLNPPADYPDAAEVLDYIQKTLVHSNGIFSK